MMVANRQLVKHDSLKTLVPLSSTSFSVFLKDPERKLAKAALQWNTNNNNQPAGG